MFQIRFHSWLKIEFIFANRFHIAPTQLLPLEFYEIEYLLKELEDYNAEEEKRYKKEEIEAKRQAQSKTPKMDKPDYGGFKVPKISIPNIPKPKF